MGNVPSNETGPALLFDEKQIANVFHTQYLSIESYFVTLGQLIHLILLLHRNQFNFFTE